MNKWDANLILLKNKVNSIFIFFTFIMASVASDIYAEDTLSALMQRMKSDVAVKIAYQETRFMELMDQPWQGRGAMYSMPPDLMIREQLQPQRILMGVKADKMFYFDPENDVRHQGDMDHDDPLSLNIAVFKALINADESLLHSLYLVDFSSGPQQWQMTLIPKQESDSGFHIVVTGQPGQQAKKISVYQADGDHSDFSLQKDSAGDKIEQTVDQLFKELQGE